VPHDLDSPVLLGRALRILRQRAGLTQEQLADRLNAHPTFVGRLERGLRGAHWRTVMRILAALDADLHDLANAMQQAQKQR
jgi:transcriptional regulator with XRE-family HTH domain